MSAADEAKWRSLFGSMAAQWPNMILFDNFGFAIVGGDTTLIWPTMRSTSWPMRGGSASARDTDRRFYYLDVALFPARFEQAYDEFRQSLPELDG